MYILEITWQEGYKSPQNVHCFEVIPEVEDNFKNIIELPIESLKKLFIEWMNFYQPSNSGVLIAETLEPEELRKKLEELQKKCTYLENLQSGLNQKVAELSETNLCRQRDNLTGEINVLKETLRQKQQEVEKKQREINELNRKLSNLQSRNESLDNHNLSLQKNLQSSQQQHNDLIEKWNELVPQYEYSQRQVANLSNLRQENDNLHQQNEKLTKSKKTLEEQISSIKKELEEAQQKLALATTRLHQQTVKPGIAGGGSQSDKLKNEFDNLKKGLFYDASSRVLNCWREKDNKITFRSEEFSKIKSILSQRVFTDGISYFAGDKSEVNTNVDLIMNELVLLEELTLTPSVLPAIQQKIEGVVLRSKGVDHSDEALMKYVEISNQNILQDLEQIRDFSLSEDVQKEIKNFVEAGLKLVREVVKDPSSGEFYIPETGAEFDESLHDTRDEPEGKVKLTICAGYRIPGTVLVKADVVTYLPNIPTISDVSDTRVNLAPASSVTDISNRQTTLNVLNTTVTSPTELFTLEDGNVINEDKQDESLVNQEQQHKPISNLEESDEHKGIYAASFTGKVIPKAGVHLYTQPQNDQSYYSDYTAIWDRNLTFDAWTYSDEMKFANVNDSRWYKIAGENLWVPGSHIEGEPPNTSKIPPN